MCISFLDHKPRSVFEKKNEELGYLISELSAGQLSEGFGEDSHLKVE